MSEAQNIRRYMRLMEYSNPLASDSISYQATEVGGKITKIVATLKSYLSGRYTRLGRNLLEIERLDKEIKRLKAETKEEARELIADLFSAEDAVATRVVETVSFTFELTKDPKATETYKYAEILKELESSLTPELVTMLEALKAKHKSTVQKAAGLKATDKAVEGINEGMGAQLKGFFAKLLSRVQSWAQGYDSKLAALKSQVAMGESLDEAEGHLAMNSLVRINAPHSNGHGDYGHITAITDDGYQVTLYGMGFHGIYGAEELEPATPEQVDAYYRQG
jgi:hypothetical protein